MGRLRFAMTYLGDMTETRHRARGGAAGAAIEESAARRAGRAGALTAASEVLPNPDSVASSIGTPDEPDPV